MRNDGGQVASARSPGVGCAAAEISQLQEGGAKHRPVGLNDKNLAPQQAELPAL
jgi:hypothetical protein